ncbi:MAG: hypothetical protein WC521_01585 [Bdellovibrionales bacterium]
MPDYHDFMMRHGEFGVQDLIERMERYQGIVANTNIPLEKRWASLLSHPDTTEFLPMTAVAR